MFVAPMGSADVAMRSSPISTTVADRNVSVPLAAGKMSEIVMGAIPSGMVATIWKTTSSPMARSLPWMVPENPVLMRFGKARSGLPGRWRAWVWM